MFWVWSTLTCGQQFAECLVNSTFVSILAGKTWQRFLLPDHFCKQPSPSTALLHFPARRCSGILYHIHSFGSVPDQSWSQSVAQVWITAIFQAFLARQRSLLTESRAFHGRQLRAHVVTFMHGPNSDQRP